MKIRLMGSREQNDAAARVLRQVFDVVDETHDYPNCPPSALVRRYLTVRLATDH